jgi:hypothetical protein
VPKELQKDIENVKNSRNTEGKLSTQAVSNILNLRISEKEKNKLMYYAKRNAMTSQNILSIGFLTSQGKTFEEALKKLNEVKVIKCYLAVDTSKTNEFLKENNMSFVSYVRKVLSGQMKANTSILA